MGWPGCEPCIFTGSLPSEAKSDWVPLQIAEEPSLPSLRSVNLQFLGNAVELVLHMALEIPDTNTKKRRSTFRCICHHQIHGVHTGHNITMVITPECIL